MRPPSIGVTQDTQRLRKPIDTQETQRETTSSALSRITPEAEPLEDHEKSTRRWKHDKGEWFAEAVANPLPDFMCLAWQYNQRELEGDGAWHTPLFNFTWLLRGHPTMEQNLSKPNEALKIVEMFLRDWTRHSIRKGTTPPHGIHDGDGWMEWFGIERDEARAEFVDVWEKSRYLPGSDPLKQARDANVRCRLTVCERVAAKRPIAADDETQGKDYQAFIGIAGHLQVAMGAANITLPCGKLGAVMGVSKMTISRYRRWAIDDGYIVVMRDHKFRSNGKGDATEFRFNVDRFSVLSNKSQATTTDPFTG